MNSIINTSCKCGYPYMVEIDAPITCNTNGRRPHYKGDDKSTTVFRCRNCDEVLDDLSKQDKDCMLSEAITKDTANYYREAISEFCKENGIDQEIKEDLVNHPKHYTSHPSGVECITITEHMLFNIGNAIKYLWRADHKGNDLEDLRKAAFYVNREISRREGVSNG